MTANTAKSSDLSAVRSFAERSGPSGHSAWPLAIPHLPRLSPFGTIFKLGERHDGKPRAAQGCVAEGSETCQTVEAKRAPTLKRLRAPN